MKAAPSAGNRLSERRHPHDEYLVLSAVTGAGPARPPTFNLADVAIRLGALIAVIAALAAAARPGPSRTARWRHAITTRHGTKLLCVVPTKYGH
jgi:hypothetical protein